MPWTRSKLFISLHGRLLLHGQLAHFPLGGPDSNESVPPMGLVSEATGSWRPLLPQLQHFVILHKSQAVIAAIFPKVETD